MLNGNRLRSRVRNVTKAAGGCSLILTGKNNPELSLSNNQEFSAMFREMAPDDLPQVFLVRTATIENAVSMEKLEEYGITEDSLTKALQSHVKGWVYEDSDKITGFVMGDESTGEILVLAVLLGLEKQGIGSSLLLRVQEWLFSTGHDQLWLKTTPDPSLRACGFYQRHGWLATGEIEGEDEIFILRRESGLSSNKPKY